MIEATLSFINDSNIWQYLEEFILSFMDILMSKQILYSYIYF